MLASAVINAGRVANTLDSWHLGRYREILKVLVRFGLADFFENLSRGRLTPPRISPQALREALTELGPAFIKLGQMLSDREELLPPAFRQELALLQDQVPPFSGDLAIGIIESEFGEGLGCRFAGFDPIPLAVGSIGQVHRAHLRDGSDVAVKVQRPGIGEALARDSAIIRHLSEAIEDQAGWGKQTARLISDFLENVRLELDYVREAEQLERFAWQCEYEPGVRVPRPIREASGKRVLTMTWTAGTKICELDSLAPAVDRKAAARRLGVCVLQQIFAFGYFHGDPHAANVFVQDDRHIGFYDLGLVGELSRGERESLAAFVLGLLEQNADAATAAVDGFAGSAGAAGLRSAISELIGKYFHQPSAGAPVHCLLADILKIAARHDLRLPSAFYVALKALVTLDSVGRKLDPEFDMAQLALPILRRLRPRPSLRIDSADALDIGLDALDQLRKLPAALATSVGQLNDGKLKIQFEHRGLEEALMRYERATGRTSAASLAAAIALGSLAITGFAVGARAITLWQAGVAGVGIAIGAVILMWLLTRIFGSRR